MTGLPSDGYAANKHPSYDPTYETLTKTGAAVVTYTLDGAAAYETVTKTITSTVTPAGTSCGAPVVPTTPAAPVVPVAPVYSGKPDWPAAPVVPATPSTPVSPVVPAKPDTPYAPYTPSKPSATTSRVYSPVLATANAAVQNGVAGAAMIAAAAFALI